MSPWLEIGKARLEGDTKIIPVAIDRTPVGGLNGYVYFVAGWRETARTGTAAGSTVPRGGFAGARQQRLLTAYQLNDQGFLAKCESWFG